MKAVFFALLLCAVNFSKAAPVPLDVLATDSEYFSTWDYSQLESLFSSGSDDSAVASDVDSVTKHESDVYLSTSEEEQGATSDLTAPPPVESILDTTDSSAVDSASSSEEESVFSSDVASSSDS
ncbi:hypothetical protein J3F81_006212, partial [Coemansia sp. RSA 371]